MGNRIDTQDRLIAATRQIIIDEGVEATSLERICKRAGFTRGAFYSNFASKDSLLAALAEDEYDGLIARLRATVEAWAARPGIAAPSRGAGPTIDGADDRPRPEAAAGADPRAPMIETLLYEALDAIGIDKALYLVHSELLMRSIRDPEWGERLLDINLAFVDELGYVLEWILEAAGRRLTRNQRAMTHSVIGIVMRAAGVAAWREVVGPRSRSTGPARPEAGPVPVRDSSAREVLDVVLEILYASSEPVGEVAPEAGKGPRHPG
ncbi:TetR/AcrR family transcriptional regulator [Actinomyces sp. B33]|uniref:TetR/AcrR family transcriptional regulator n=1 Tax=Actinomyces sp. B33 TaxID=2942131 RepID=UPI0023411BAA|nr:helix-turn-helix domain-containing protein [Actinomyces sp. B33]MDC4232393.1 TetR/AcrR family transcriptional regulator [Actinomyces sp. B33]